MAGDVFRFTPPAPVKAARSADDDCLVHIWCCCRNVGLCGTDLSDAEDSRDAARACVVCAYLDRLPCEVCHRAHERPGVFRRVWDWWNLEPGDRQ